MHFINRYAPQVGLDKKTKGQLYNSLDELVQKTSPPNKIFLGGNLNGHVELQEGV